MWNNLSGMIIYINRIKLCIYKDLILQTLFISNLLLGQEEKHVDFESPDIEFGKCRLQKLHQTNLVIYIIDMSF